MDRFFREDMRELENIRDLYLRDASKREVDFLVTNDDKPWFAVECKTSGSAISPAQRGNIGASAPQIYGDLMVHKILDSVVILI